jgi:hypothetical protein
MILSRRVAARQADGGYGRFRAGVAHADLPTLGTSEQIAPPSDFERVGDAEAGAKLSARDGIYDRLVSMSVDGWAQAAT